MLNYQRVLGFDFWKHLASPVNVAELSTASSFFRTALRIPISRNYLLFHQPLLDWIVEQMNEQRDTDKWEETGGRFHLASPSLGDSRGFLLVEDGIRKSLTSIQRAS